MSLGILDRSPPPLFKQGPSALSQVVFFVALSVFLMVADARFQVLEPVRAVIATVVWPVQRALVAPVEAWATANDYMAGVAVARTSESRALERLNQQSVQAQRAQTLAQENDELRAILGLRERLKIKTIPTEILYEAPDPFSRKVIIDRGLTHGVQRGAPVVNEMGVLGQVTRTYPLTSEVTLLTDREAAIPVLNSRTNQRGAAYGDPTSAAGGGGMELRFMANNADLQAGDLLTTSGVDGVYPAGLPVAKVMQVDRRADSSFAKVLLTPVAVTDAVRLAMVIDPIGGSLPPRPAFESPLGKTGAAAKAAAAASAASASASAAGGVVLLPEPFTLGASAPPATGAQRGAGKFLEVTPAPSPMLPSAPLEAAMPPVVAGSDAVPEPESDAASDAALGDR